MSESVDRYGRVWKVTADYGAVGTKKLGFSKASLGLFMFTLYKLGGEIGEVHVMGGGRYRNAYVQASLKIHPDKIAEFESDTGIKLENPATIKLN